MRAPRTAILVAALVFAAQADLSAQQGPPVTAGDRVRVTAPTTNPDPILGTLVSMGADTCVLEVRGRAEPITLPLVSVTNLEVSRGKKDHALVGAGVGFGIGAVSGGVLAAGLGENANAGAGILLFGLAGSLVGTAVGAFIRTEGWEVVDLQSVRASLTPLGSRGLAVSVSFRF